MMLHGLGANELEFQRLAKELNAAGFTVVVPHIGGYTYNTPPQSWTVWVEQVQAELWKLEKIYASVSLVGLSMGAVLAMVVAQRQTRPLAGLVLFGGMGDEGMLFYWNLDCF